MNNQGSGKTNLFALLIGIDCYLPNALPGGYYYASLGGCVRDISHVEDFLRRKLGVPQECILKLTATNVGKAEPFEPRDQWPTYQNMVDSFNRLTSMAQAGDQVYIHYSGHGGRVPTKCPYLKGPDGLDEALVPTDIGNSEARYLRDVEIAHLLKTMVDKGLIVTVVLDSCHSGSATRGLGSTVAVPRRATPMPGVAASVADFVDTTPRPAESQVAAWAVLEATWRGLAGDTARGVKPSSGWLLEPQGYTLLAACRASESAFESNFDGQERNGALTYWLLDSLKQIGPGLSYKMLHDRILAKVHSQFQQQTPQLQGAGNRTVFGSERVQAHYAVLVLQVDTWKYRVLLEAGQAHGLRKGAKFAIYPASADLTQLDQRLAIVEIVELGATDSWAQVVDKLSPQQIEQGAQAVLLEPGDIRLQRAIRIDVGSPETRVQIERAIKENTGGFVTFVPEGERFDFLVTVDNSGKHFEIRDSAQDLISNVRPEIDATEQNAAALLSRRLEHLAKFRNVQELDNRDAMSPLARSLVVELAGVQADYDPVDPPKPMPISDPGNTPTIEAGHWIFLRVRNNLAPGVPNDPARILNITIMDLQPDWGITQIYPSGAGFFEPLDPGQEILLPLRTSLPDEYTEGNDIIKVFATVGTTNFRWLELPSLDQPQASCAATRGKPRDPLENLLAAVTAQGPKTRTVRTEAFPSRAWVTAQVEVHIRKE